MTLKGSGRKASACTCLTDVHNSGLASEKTLDLVLSRLCDLMLEHVEGTGDGQLLADKRPGRINGIAAGPTGGLELVTMQVEPGNGYGVGLVLSEMDRKDHVLLSSTSMVPLL